MRTHGRTLEPYLSKKEIIQKQPMLTVNLTCIFITKSGLRQQRDDAAINDVLASYLNMTSDATSMSASQISAVVDGLMNVVIKVSANPQQVSGL